jgi:hypothetical protein
VPPRPTLAHRFINDKDARLNPNRSIFSQAGSIGEAEENCETIAFDNNFFPLGALICIHAERCKTLVLCRFSRKNNRGAAIPVFSQASFRKSFDFNGVVRSANTFDYVSIAPYGVSWCFAFIDKVIIPAKFALEPAPVEKVTEVVAEIRTMI